MRFTANWHTHNFRCRHASGDFAEYARAAIGAGIGVLGISDHSPTPDNRDIGVRMFRDELAGYISGFHAAKELFPSLRMHLGLELEYFEDIMPGWADELRGEGIEYLAAAPHFFTLADGSMVNPWLPAPREDRPRFLAAYGEFVVKMIASGRYAFVAHPDLFGCFCSEWLPECDTLAREVAAAARDTGTPLEINAAGFYHRWIGLPDGGRRPPYPWEPFWRIVAESGATVIINSDAHVPEAIAKSVGDAFGLAGRCGIRPATFTDVAGGRLSSPLPND
ncbi:MAG: hypothetical protein IKH04_02395 [Kiritimatiellae bacterium]|nr:hypothetical protein [Kiritimatiellia bacterium]